MIVQSINVFIIVAVVLGVSILGVVALIAWYVARRRRQGNWTDSMMERLKGWLFNGSTNEAMNVEKRVLAPTSSGSISTKSRESIFSFASVTDYSSMGSNLPAHPSTTTTTTTGTTINHDPQLLLPLTSSPMGTRRFSGPCSPSHLGSIDPSLYVGSSSRRHGSLGGATNGSNEDCGGGDDDDDDDDYPPNRLGRVRFSVQYSMDSEKFTVVLHQCRGLPSRNPGSAIACDPFFKLTLLPDTRSQCRSSFKKKTCNPKFEETFVFQVPVKDFDNRILKLTACDVNRLRRHNVIGHVIYPLKTSGMLLENGSKKITVQRDLENEDTAEMALEYKGEILISLSFNERTERLNVGIYEGKGFKKVVESAGMDFYVKVTLMKNNGPVKSKKTDVIRGDSSPKFNQSFSFKQSNEGILTTACVIVSVIQSVAGHKDKMLGRVVIGSFMFARGKELEHWNFMIAKQQENIPCWHILT